MFYLKLNKNEQYLDNKCHKISQWYLRNVCAIHKAQNSDHV